MRLVASLLGQLSKASWIKAFPRLDESTRQCPQAMTDRAAAFDQQDVLLSCNDCVGGQRERRSVLLSISNHCLMFRLALTVCRQLRPGLQIIAHTRLDV